MSDISSSTKRLRVIEDLIDGKGEWRNIQDVVRNTFRQCLELNEKQQVEIEKITKKNLILKEELERRPKWEDIEKMVDMKLNYDSKARRPAANNEIDQLKAQVSLLKSELEKKVSMQYFEQSVGSKISKSDLLVKDLQKHSVVEFSEQLNKQKYDIMDLRSCLDDLKNILTRKEQKGISDSHILADITIMKTQIENIYRHMNDFETKDTLFPMLAQKLSRNELDSILSKKLDIDQYHESITKLEHIVSQHEKLITSLRLSANDPEVFDSEVFSKKDTIKASKASKNHTSTTDELDQSLLDGKVESLVGGLWHKTNAVIKEYQKVRKELYETREEMDNLRRFVSQAASLEKVDTLSTVVEEQRLRIDSILQGSTKIQPIFKELKKFQDNIKEIQEFLTLPRSQPLQNQLLEFSTLISDLSDRVTHVDSIAQNQVKARIEALTAQTESLEARWSTTQHDKSRIAYIMDHIDIADTRFNNMKEISRSLEELWRLVDNPYAKGESLLAKSSNNNTVLERVKSLEKYASKNQREVDDCQQKIQRLKDYVVSIGNDLPLPKDPIITGIPSSSSKSKRFSTLATRGSVPLYSNENISTDFSSINEKDELNLTELNENKISDPPSPIPQAPIQPKKVNATIPNTEVETKRQQLNSATVDFEAALGQIFSSIDDLKLPIRADGISPHHTRQSPNDSFLISISEVDKRLHELNNEKQRLRGILLSRV